MAVICPHCSAANTTAGDFCSSCGMALPSATPSSPRIVTSKASAITAAGQKLQSQELLRTARQAARSLLSIGIVNLAFGALNLTLIFNLYNTRHGRISPYFQAITASMTVAGFLYIAMYFWAKYSPLAATIVGLGIYLAKWVVDIAIQTTLASNATANSSTNTYGLVRIVMVIYLIRGIGAGLRHRKLEQQQLEGQQPLAVLPVK